MRFAENLIRNSATPIHYLWSNGINGEGKHWLIMCSSEKYRALMANINKLGTKIEDYAVIIASGVGHEVPQETKDMLLEKYDLKFDEYFA